MLHQFESIKTPSPSVRSVDSSTTTTSAAQNLLRNFINTTTKQSATISGAGSSKIPAVDLLFIKTASSNQQQKTNLVKNKTGSVTCVNSAASVAGITSGNGSLSGSTKLFLSAKRKRASLFNLFSFQKPSSVGNSNKQLQNNDENEPAAVQQQETPPPPPEFADTNQQQQQHHYNYSHRKHSYSVKATSTSSSSSITNESIPTSASFKQHRSIFNALRRKSVKSMPPPTATKDVSPINYKEFFASIKDTPIVSYNSSESEQQQQQQEQQQQHDLAEDAESTITNLFSFDNYLTPSKHEQETIEEQYYEELNDSKDLNYAKEFLLEDESYQLSDLHDIDRFNNMATAVRKDKLKKYCRNQQILSTISKQPTTSFESVSSTSNIDQCIHINSNNNRHHNHNQSDNSMLSYEQQQHLHQTQQSTIKIVKSTQIVQQQSLASPTEQYNNNNRKHDHSSSSSLMNKIGSKTTIVNKNEQGFFRSYINDSDSENQSEYYSESIDSPLIQSRKPTLEEVDINTTTEVRNKRIQGTNSYDSSASTKSLINNNEQQTTKILKLIYENSSKSRVIEMVQLKKGLKLRELLNPVLSAQKLNIDNFNIYATSGRDDVSMDNQQNENYGEINKQIDANTLCDKFINVELTLKPKNLTTPETVLTDFNNTLSIETTLNLNQEYTTAVHSPIMNNNNVATSKLTLSSSSSISSSSPSSSPTILSTPKITSIQQQTPKQQQPLQSTTSLPPIPTTPSIPITTTSATNHTPNPKVNQKRYSAVAANDEQPLPITQHTRYSTSSITSLQSYLSISQNGSINTKDTYTKAKPFHSKFPISSLFNINSNNNNNTNNNQNQNNKAVTEQRLVDKLNGYLTELPVLPEQLKNSICSYDESILDIEPEWQSIVGESFLQSVPVKQAKQQMAIWELFTTEVSHIKLTKVILNLYLNCLHDLKTSEQTKDMFKDIEIDRLFLNIVEIFNCNLKFWQHYLHPLVDEVNRKTSTFLINPCRLKLAFSQFKTVFAPYDTFCIGQTDATEYLKQKIIENDFFRSFISWAENHTLSERLKLTDLMMKPIQRITKYNLLLEKILGFAENTTQCSEIAEMQRSVKDLVNSFNTKLNHLTQFNNLVDSIETYEGVIGAVEVQKILDEYRKFDLRASMPGCSPNKQREIIHQGPLKLKDLSKTIDVQGILFTDMLLIIKERKGKKPQTYKIIKPPIPTNRIEIREIKDDKALVIIQLNDYNMPDAAYVLTTSHYKRWVDYLDEAKRKYKAEIESYDKILIEKHSQKVLNEDVFFTNSDLNSPTSSIHTQETNTILDSRQNSISVTETIENNNNDEQEQEVTVVVNATATATAGIIDEEIEENVTIDDDNDDSKNNSIIIADQVHLLDNSMDTIGVNNNHKLNLSMELGETDDNDEIASESTLKSSDKLPFSTSFDLVENAKIIEEDDEQLPQHLHHHHHQRSSSTTSNTASTSSSSSLSSPSPISPPLPLQQQFKYQQHHSPHSRKLGKFKGRYMTDPLTSTQQKDRIQDNDSLYRISKRNSLNDRLESQAALSSPTSPNNQQELLMLKENANQNLTKNVYGDSTSTIMSTDSGVSSTTYGGRQSNSIESIEPDFKLSEEEVNEIYKDFVKVSSPSQGVVESKNECVNSKNDSQQQLNVYEFHPHATANEIAKQKYFDSFSSLINNRNDYCEISNTNEHSTNNSSSNEDVCEEVAKQQQHDMRQAPKWYTNYQDRESVSIPLVVGQMTSNSDLNNNNVIHKLSPQVYSSFSLDSPSVSSLPRKHTYQKLRFERNGSNNNLNGNKTNENVTKTPVLRLDGQNSKFKTIKSSSLSMSPAGGSKHHISEFTPKHIKTIKQPFQIHNSFDSHLMDTSSSINNNTENEIQLITSQMPSIVRLSSTRMISQQQNSVEKRCATPIDYVYAQQYENSKQQQQQQQQLTTNDQQNYDSTIKSANSTPNSHHHRFNNHQQQQQQQQHFMLVNLLHTTQDATEV